MKKYLLIHLFIIKIIIINRQHSKVLNRLRVRKRGKKGNHGKVGVKRKWWVLAQPPYSPQEYGSHLTRGIDHLMWRRTQGAVIVEGCEDKRDLRHISYTFT